MLKKKEKKVTTVLQLFPNSSTLIWQSHNKQNAGIVAFVNCCIFQSFFPILMFLALFYSNAVFFCQC